MYRKISLLNQCEKLCFIVSYAILDHKSHVLGMKKTTLLSLSKGTDKEIETTETTEEVQQENKETQNQAQVQADSVQPTQETSASALLPERVR